MMKPIRCIVMASTCMAVLTVLEAVVSGAAAETREVVCGDATLWYDARMSARIVSEDGGACFFEVSLPAEFASDQPGAVTAHFVQEAWSTTDKAKQMALIGTAQVPFLESLVFPLLKDSRFADIGGAQLFGLIKQHFDEAVTACTVSAFAGKEVSSKTEEGLGYMCRVEGESVYRLSLSFGAVSVQVLFPLA